MHISRRLLKINTTGVPFRPFRGIRQGDSLSPYISIIAMKYLARTLQKESITLRPNIWVKSVSRGTPNPFLNFANDTLILAKANNKSLIKIKEILADFSLKAGLTINFKQSSMQVRRISQVKSLIDLS